MDQIKADGDRAIAIGPFGSRMKAESYVASGVPVIRGNNLSNTRGFVGDFVFVSDKTADELKSSNVVAGDLVFPHRGAIGQVGIVPDDGTPRYMLSTSLMKLSCNRALVDPRFVFYFFRSTVGRSALLERASTVGTPGIGQPLASLRSIQVPVPPIEEQRAIAHVLGTLDDKIELNRRMSETLEAMARALFKSWFVDFEPVRAKAEGRDSGLPEPIAKLFPESLEDSEQGEVPTGWIPGSFGELAARRAERVGSREVAVLSAVASGALVRSDEHFSKRVYSEETSNYLLVEQWDFAYNPSRINIGSIGMLEESILGGVSPVYVVFRPDPAYRWFLEFALRQPQTRAWINTLASGSVRQSLSYEEFASIPCAIPPQELVSAFDRCWESLRARMEAGAAESSALGELRDALLPVLLSGRLEVEVRGRSQNGAL